MVWWIAGTAVAYGVKKLMDADKKEARAERINANSFQRIADAEEKVMEMQYITRMSLEKLANRKRGILNTSIKDFIDTYEKIMAIEFHEGDGIKELKILTIPRAIFNEMKQLTAVASTPMSDKQVLYTFIVGGIPGLIENEAEQRLSESLMRKKQAAVIESQSETFVVALDAIKQRSDRISEVLAKLNLIFRKSIKQMEQVIARFGQDRLTYQKSDRRCIMVAVNLAMTIKKILDTKLLDEKGEITTQSIEAIKMGDQFLSQLDLAIK